ncbi:MAG: P1 family peptidase [Acidobacteriota bacterium]
MDDDAGSLTDVAGIRVGHFTDSRRPTGCTVVLTERPMTAGVDVRGSAPGTRETDLLAPLNTVTVIDAVLLSGGSAFGLDAAAGVVRYLEERGRGYQTGVGPVPIVPAAILFDLSIGDPGIRPDAEAGYRACLHAGTGPVEEGNVGAGAGATVGKLLGMEHAMKGGIGSASLRIGGLVVAALAVVNCIGDVRHPETGQILAGCRDRKGSGFADLRRVLRSRNISAPDMAGRNSPSASRRRHGLRTVERRDRRVLIDPGRLPGCRRDCPGHCPGGPEGPEHPRLPGPPLGEGPEEPELLQDQSDGPRHAERRSAGSFIPHLQRRARAVTQLPLPT